MIRSPDLPIRRRARSRYGLDPQGTDGFDPAAWSDLETARRVAERINASRDLIAMPEAGVSAGAIFALGLIHAHARRTLERYRDRGGRDLLVEALRWLENQYGRRSVRRLFETFDALYGSAPLHDSDAHGDASKTDAEGKDPANEGPADEDPEGGHPADEDPATRLADILILWLAVDNPATAPVRELLDDHELEQATGYRAWMDALDRYWRSQADPELPDLIEAIRAPATHAPASVEDQLSFVLERDRPTISPPRTQRMALGLDVLREESKPVFVGPPGPPPPPPEPDFSAFGNEAARYSRDQAWMPSLVLVAKNVLVWLDQLSREHGAKITRLDDIPDAALETLRDRGFTGLWLIGLWRRSPASAQIKHLRGQEDAVASAYALDDYQVDEALGGDEALEDLETRARRVGLRLACDMVPNHMGLDSRWLVEQPQRFLSLERCPFPGYSFTGPDLSHDPTVHIHLEDHYFDQTDAAVVFRRTDVASGEVRYVYHGNDGTALPWNDTAQLDYLAAETRDAIIETIVDVARRFPIIRFDAAMTLARQHVQRLWHPPPGQAGDIPSRAEHGVDPKVFDQQMPEEFWREVVDRIARDAPDTLLLAEAFWLMESYFVRSLGMHRVYNSAFMHMLRDEDNGKLRRTLAGVLAFDPALLQRYVNFLTTPDEPPAAEQFGRGDKFFGAATLMVTLPGLPLFGHGQVEGLREKYGMEYQRPRLDERPDPALLAGHERRLAPLLRQRALFAGVEHFAIFDFEAADGTVIDDVFALANRLGEQTALVFFHNRAQSVAGTIRRTVPRRDPDEATSRHSLLAALAPPVTDREAATETITTEDRQRFFRCRDPIRELDYLLPERVLATRGLELNLGPYESRVLLGFTPLEDTADQRWSRLVDEIGDRGVPDLDVTLRTLLAEPMLAPWRQQGLSADDLGAFLGGGAWAEVEEHEHWARRIAAAAQASQQAEQDAIDTDAAAATSDRDELDVEALAAATRRGLEAYSGVANRDAIAEASAPRRAAFLCWALLRHLGHRPGSTQDPGIVARGWIDRWCLDIAVREALEGLGSRAQEARQETAACRLFIRHQAWYSPRSSEETPARMLERLLRDDDMRRFLRIHRFDDVVWFDREAYRALTWWLEAVAAVGSHGGTVPATAPAWQATIDALVDAESHADYRLDALMAHLDGEDTASPEL